MSVAEDQPRLSPDPPPHDAGALARIRAWLFTRQPKFQVGTLRYTGFGLIMVFVWLLWGDFCFNLLDQNIPGVLPLKLHEIGAGDTMNSVLNGTIAYAITFFLAPIVSFRSDRTRTRWGRRIPYLMWSTPFVGLFLILIGCYDSIGNVLLHGASQVKILGMTLSRTGVYLLVLGVMFVGWDLANIFVNTVYYYLFNDVVPTRYLSRFFAFFRICFSLSAMAYNKWIFKHSLDHFRMLFVIAGIAYAVGFMLMCFFVREGEYPPPPENLDKREGFISSVKTYAKECFTHQLYWYFFLANTCVFSARLSLMFTQIRNTSSLHLTLEQIGNYLTWYVFIGLLLQYPAGWLSDRFHPLRVYIVATIWATLGTMTQCVWIFRDFGPHGNLVYMYVTGLSFMPLLLIAEAAELPMYMRLLPKDRYGQFASANAMVRAFAKIFLSIAVGAFIGSFQSKYGESRYTWLAAWQLFFQVIAVVFLLLLYRQWKRHGGDTSYIPPGVEVTEARGFEVVIPATAPVESGSSDAR